MTPLPPPLQLDIGIGGIQVRLRTVSPGFIALMQERFRGFIVPCIEPDHVFDVEVIPFETPLDETPVDDDDPGVSVLREAGGWRLLRRDFDAAWQPGAGHGTVRLHPSPYSLDSVLRILHTVLLADQGGMLMHASSVVLHGRAWLFTGVSGAGKTTISRLAPANAHLLTDEMSFIRLEDGQYYAHGTPFAGELAVPGANLRAPLAGIFLLGKGPDNRIEPLGAADAVRTVLANVLYFSRDDALTTRVFDNAIALAGAVPVRRLTFFPDARVWDLFGPTA
jgi:hypothetical protein